VSEELIKRTWCYAQKPSVYDIAKCKCGHAEPEWSEFEKHLWCPTCQLDFIPSHNGVFGGPILVETCEMLGIFFHRINLQTDQLELFMDDKLDEKGFHKMIPVNLNPKELAALKRFFVATTK
jgi:hypothetical protein